MKLQLEALAALPFLFRHSCMPTATNMGMSALSKNACSNLSDTPNTGGVQDLRHKFQGSQANQAQIMQRAADLVSGAEERSGAAERRADKAEARASKAEADAGHAQAEVKRLGTELKVSTSNPGRTLLAPL